MKIKTRVEKLERQAGDAEAKDPTVFWIRFDGDEDVVRYRETRCGDYLVKWPIYADGTEAF